MKKLALPLTILGLILLLITILKISGNGHLIKAVKSTYLIGKPGPTITDYSKFINDTVIALPKNQWSISRQQVGLDTEMEEKISNWETTGLLIIKNKKIVLERYWDGFDENSFSNSFSMAKSFTSIAIGSAIKEGKIKNISQPVFEFLPEFNTLEKREITIEHLLNMSSGIDFGESYGDPFGFMAKTYYGTALYDLTISKPSVKKPGAEFHYQGGNTLLLSFIIEKATGKKLPEYFSEKVWQPIGAQKDALWSITEDDKEARSYCCFYSNARDFARIGQLYLDSGKWDGQEIINKDFFNRSVSPININNNNGENVSHYGLHWWLGKYDKIDFFYARGILGQYIVIIPEKRTVLVRLGHKRDKTRNVKIPSDLFDYLDLVKDL